MRLRWFAPTVCLVSLLSAPSASASPPAAATEPARHAVYLDIMGKGGTHGLGYDYGLHRRFAIGFVTSFAQRNGQRILSLAPYAAAYPIQRGGHAWFVHAGPTVVRVSTPSPVMEWSGDRRTGWGAQASTGYEQRGRRWLWRTYVMAAAGRGGVTPWAGATVGLRF